MWVSKTSISFHRLGKQNEIFFLMDGKGVKKWINLLKQIDPFRSVERDLVAQ